MLNILPYCIYVYYLLLLCIYYEDDKVIVCDNLSLTNSDRFRTDNKSIKYRVYKI